MANYTVQFEGAYSGICIRLNELELLDKSGNKLTYTVNSAYDSRTGGLPYYWNDTGIWSKSGLNDGNKTYSPATATVLLYNTPAKIPDDTDYSRISLVCNDRPHKISLNFTGRGSTVGGVAKYVTVFQDGLLSTKNSGTVIIERTNLKNEFTEQIISRKTSNVLIYNNGQYRYYLNDWKTVGIDANEQDYLTNGMDDISVIPESAWSQLAGEVELCYYTDDPTKTEASFNIETKPFTLAEEWEDKEIKIIEYTDDPNQTESTITIETEPFTLYDELGDNVDVLYYTDDPSKTSAELNIAANYSPLDELEGDFDVVTWSDSNTSKNVQLSSIPSPQLVKQTDDYYMYGDLLAIVDKLTSTNGVLRFAVSFNEGSTWEVCKFGKWRTIDISSLATFKKVGMSHYDITSINSVALKSKGNKIRFAYYIEDNIHNSDPGIAVDNMKLNINSATETVKMDNIAFYVLNTNATIQLTLTGSKLIGILDDSDQGKVQYRILLNDKAYYPSDGSFTRLAPSPQDIDINISDRDIIFNQPNRLKVEFQDYWGETDYWETTFIGSYSGLMFMDESGEYLSDTFGGILKQLDFGIIIAGQTTLTQKVRIKNQLGYAIDNVYLEMDKKYERDGVQVELSRQANPFLPIDYLTYGLTQPDETIDFYVRIATDMRAKPNPNGLFELVVNADRV